MVKLLRQKYLSLINTFNWTKYTFSGERRNYVYSNLFPILRNRRQDIFEQVSAKVKDRAASYALGAILVVAAFAIKIGIEPLVNLSDTPFLLSFVAVVVTALSGGTKPGIFSTFLAVATAGYIAADAGYEINYVRLITFGFEGIFTSILIGKLRYSEERANQKSRLLINSEKHLRNVLNSVYVFVGVMTTSGLLVECNNASLDVANLSPDDVLGKSYEKTYWWNYSKFSRNKIRKAINKAATGQVVRFDARQRIGKHKYITVDFTLAPIKNDEGKVIYLVPSGVDISQKVKTIIENKRLYKILENEKQRLEQIVANTPGVVWESVGRPMDKDYRMIYISDYVDIILGINKEERERDGNFWKNVIHPEDRQKVIKDMGIFYDMCQGGIIKCRWVGKNGKIIWVESRFLIIKNEKGEAIGSRGVLIDITDRIRSEQKKDEFISIASHELKTPLTTIKAFTQIIEKRLSQSGDLESVSYLSKMNIYINRLTKIIYDFLDFSKIQAGKLDLNKEKFDLSIMIEEVVADIQATSETHQLIKTGVIKNLMVEGDKNRLSQVLINLIINAVKYSPDSNKVEIGWENSENKAKIWVKDYGIGIPLENQKKIFGRFYRVNQPKKIKIEGFGLGLYISSEIVKRHKGKIWFESRPGAGSTFYFSLPLLKKVE